MGAAFGDEMEITGSWPSDAHWAVMSVRLTVRDGARARKIADAFTTVPLAGATWTRTEKDGVSYYATEGFGGFEPIRPAFAISSRELIAGSDLASNENVHTKENPGARERANTALFNAPVAGGTPGVSGVL